MRTPGNDLELAAGFLLTEGIIRITARLLLWLFPIENPAKTEPVEAQLTADADFDGEKMKRNFFAASSCGICGKASIDAVRVRGIRAPNPDFRVRPEMLCEIPDRLRERQPIFSRTGGLHGAALFDAEGK